ncbi:MAG: Heavy metal efflux outer membrane protein CzcC family [Labilithrix sp.]|nr:Heavy metal efflux outer membrane protein CzcC family [Labilithrix sp.]
MKLRALAAVGCSAAALFGAVEARCDDGPLVVTRERAIALGAERAPLVREAVAPLRATVALRDASSAPLAYAPRLTASAGRRTGAFGSGLEIGGGVVQDLSLRGLGARRGDVAAAAAHAARSEVERARLEGAALAALAWVDLLEADDLARVRASAKQDAEEIARVARARTDRGVAPPSEAALGAAEVGQAELGERDAEGRLFEARAALQYAIGASPATEVVASGDVRAIDGVSPAPPPGTEHPAEAAARNRVALARADAKLARAQASPPLGVGVTYTREGQGEQVALGTVSLPLPFIDPTRFDAARHETAVASAEGQAERVRAELARDAAMAAHERLHTREVHDTLAAKVLVPLRETVRLARAAYQTGTQDVTALLIVRQRLVAAEEQLGRASADVQRADLRYALTSGTLLAGSKR